MPTKAITQWSTADLALLLRELYELEGFCLDPDKHEQVPARLEPRLGSLGITSASAFLALIKNDAHERQHIISRLAPRDTSFFRTPRIWKHLITDVLPAFHEANPWTRLHIWSAGVSTGEEAFSAAIVCEEFRLRYPGFDYDILATDISHDALDAARALAFQPRSLNYLRTSDREIHDRYFSATPWQVTQLRHRIRFLPHSIIRPLEGEPHFHLVLCRNVLSLFDSVHRELALSNIAAASQHNSLLIIGESESLSGLHTPYRYAQPLIYTLSDLR